MREMYGAAIKLCWYGESEYYLNFSLCWNDNEFYLAIYNRVADLRMYREFKNTNCYLRN